MPRGELRVMCTARGEHPSREFTIMAACAADDFFFEDTLTLGDPTGTGWAIHAFPSRMARFPGHEIHMKLIRGRRHWRFACPTCGRDVPLRDESMRRIMLGLLPDDSSEEPERRRVTVDISALPATFA